ncbi:ubiquitin-like protein 7 isoform X1 [Lasioglossum baleicum]|uniref:ubiquitin-like protein 7 isoform X1 n=1 Tax=Lasioglossum baleicum TaxID=434251 RepID=UPI003FCCC0E5
MSSEIILGLRLDPHALTTIKLNNINFKSKVKFLKSETARRVNLTKDLFELTYCGSILEDEVTLESYGLKNGSMVHVLKKEEPETPAVPRYISEDSILDLASAFKSFREDPALRSALHRLGQRQDVIANIISSSPGLHEDAAAIAIFQDPDLMAQFTDVDTVRRFAKAHPVLVEAAQNIAAAIHEEARNNATAAIQEEARNNATAATHEQAHNNATSAIHEVTHNNATALIHAAAHNNTTAIIREAMHNNATAASNNSVSNTQPTAYSYNLDNLSDDEEMAGDSSQSSDSTQPSNLSNNPSNTTITAAQLAAAVSRARTRSFPLSNTPSSTSGGSTNSGVITTEMFNQAMQQASVATTGLITDPILPPILPPVLPQFTDLQRQLAQMHEIGLQDDTINIQALQFTNGDVQAAIELVFSGFSNN